MMLNCPQFERPREKVIYNGIETLSNQELIAVILRTGNKEMSVLNNEFLVNLEQFDKLIESAKTNEEINTINMVILSSYEEMVIKS